MCPFPVVGEGATSLPIVSCVAVSSLHCFSFMLELSGGKMEQININKDLRIEVKTATISILYASDKPCLYISN